MYRVVHYSLQLNVYAVHMPVLVGSYVGLFTVRMHESMHAWCVRACVCVCLFVCECVHVVVSLCIICVCL